MRREKKKEKKTAAGDETRRCRFKASISRRRLNVSVAVFTWPPACCRCDHFLLWYEVKICQRLSCRSSSSVDEEEQKDGGEDEGEEVSSTTCQSRFLVSCLEISFIRAGVFTTLCSFGIFPFHVISAVKHARINAATFGTNSWSVTNRLFKATALCLLLWFIVKIPHGTFMVLLKCCFQRENHRREEPLVC